MATLSKQTIQANENIMVSRARTFAELVTAESDASIIITEAMEASVSKATRPLVLCFELAELLADKLDDLPLVGSGPDNNNPDRYVKGYNKKTGEAQFGSFYDWFCEYLPVFAPHHALGLAISEAEKKEGVIPEAFSYLGNMPPSELAAVKRTLATRKRATKEVVKKSIRIYQMAEMLSEYETVEVTYSQVTGKDGEQSLDLRTTNPVILKERFWKKDKDGNVVTDTTGDKVAVYSGKQYHMSVDDFIKLEPATAATMDGGFSFDNLMTARRLRLKREREEADAAAREQAKAKWQPADWFVAVENILGYVDIDSGGDKEEKHLMHIRQVMDKDETRMAQVMQAAMIFDILYDEYKDRFARYNKAQNEASNGTDKVRATA